MGGTQGEVVAVTQIGGTAGRHTGKKAAERVRTGAGRGRCARRADILARHSRIWDGYPVGHCSGFWVPPSPPCAAPSAAACPGASHSPGPSPPPRGCWGPQSRVPTAVRPAAMAAAPGEGGGSPDAASMGTQATGTSVPSAAATMVAGPSAAGDGDTMGCWVAWWVSPSPGLHPHGGHHPVTVPPGHPGTGWAAPRRQGQRVPRCCTCTERHGVAFTLPAAPWEPLAASKAEFLEQIKGKPQRPGATLPSTRERLFLVPELIEIHGGKGPGKRGDGDGHHQP